jgi:hypothetical protein
MIEVIITISLFTYGIHAMTREGMIFGKVEAYWEANGNPLISKPLTECPPCMAAWWGLIVVMITPLDLFSSIAAIVAAIGLNYIISRWI